MSLAEDPRWMNISEFRAAFEKLVRNREVICDNEGRVKASCIRYYRKYNLLANQVMVLGMIVANDKIERLHIPNNSIGSACLDEIRQLAHRRKEKFIHIINRGTYRSFTCEIDFLAADAEKIWHRYVAMGMYRNVATMI